MLLGFLQMKKLSKSEGVLTIFAAFFHLNRTVNPDYWMLQKSHKYLKKALTLDHNRSTVVFFRLENTSIENTISEKRKINVVKADKELYEISTEANKKFKEILTD